MIKTCEHCGKIFETEYPTKLYCSKHCTKAARFDRDESYYQFPHEPDAEPLFTFECTNCGKTVKVYSRYDQRTRFCCGQCAKKYELSQNRKQQSKRRGGNMGLSGGMSLGSLIRREARDLK